MKNIHVNLLKIVHQHLKNQEQSLYHVLNLYDHEESQDRVLMHVLHI